MKRYRLHFKAIAGHTTYSDYKHLSSARRAMNRIVWPGWTATHIETIEIA